MIIHIAAHSWLGEFVEATRSNIALSPRGVYLEPTLTLAMVVMCTTVLTVNMGIN